MKNYLISIKKANETNLIGADSLDKADRLIILYEGDDSLISISIPMYTVLSNVKAKVEFKKIAESDVDSPIKIESFAFYLGVLSSSSDVFLVEDSGNGDFFNNEFVKHMESLGKEYGCNVKALKELKAETVKKASVAKPRTSTPKKKSTETETTNETANLKISEKDFEGSINPPEEDSDEKPNISKSATKEKKVKNNTVIDKKENTEQNENDVIITEQIEQQPKAAQKKKSEADILFDKLYSELEMFLNSRKTREINPRNYIFQLANANKEAKNLGKTLKECIPNNVAKDVAGKLDRALSKDFDLLTKKLEELPDEL